MPIKDHGTVCDISVLTNLKSIKKAQNLFNSSGLYLPNPTYSWLSRSKLIEVRNQAVKYTLIKQQVRERKLYPTHLPELYDELSRQIMFSTEHKVALTDLRGLLLAAHLQLPLLTFDNNLLKRISKEIGILTIRKFKAQANWLSIRNILELYRELLFTSGKRFYKSLENGKKFPTIIEEIKKSEENNFKTMKSSIEKNKNQKNNDSEKLQFHYLAWDITSSIQEYYDQRILLPEVLRKICERYILLIATPSELNSSK